MLREPFKLEILCLPDPLFADVQGNSMMAGTIWDG